MYIFLTVFYSSFGLSYSRFAGFQGVPGTGGDRPFPVARSL